MRRFSRRCRKNLRIGVPGNYLLRPLRAALARTCTPPFASSIKLLGAGDKRPDEHRSEYGAEVLERHTWWILSILHPFAVSRFNEASKQLHRNHCPVIFVELITKCSCRKTRSLGSFTQQKTIVNRMADASSCFCFLSGRAYANLTNSEFSIAYQRSLPRIERLAKT